MADNLPVNSRMNEIEEEEEEEDELENQPEDWDDWNTEEEDSDPDFVCLFCDYKFSSIEPLFQHCSSIHFFDFPNIRKTLELDFYDSFKLINFVRTQVALNSCWSCGLECQSNKDLQNHLHEPVSLKDGISQWKDDKYLKPFMQDDSLLHSFGEDEDVQEESSTFDKEELIKELMISENLESICFEDENMVDTVDSGSGALNENGSKEASFSSNGSLTMLTSLSNVSVNDTNVGKDIESPYQNRKDKHLKVAFANVFAKEVKDVNANYFGAYSSFGIHREMISDKVRMDAYRGAILNNPSLMHCATVMDVGCGTGILSLFAAQAGASRVIAVEASEKMASVATQIAKDNGLLWNGSSGGDNGKSAGVVQIVQGMVEDLDKKVSIPAHSVDVLLSEWMGYCLLYESMLSSVLYARDRWLKPGGAILPDTATIFVAGFGSGGTSIPFWENVYGFNMSCIGKEVVEDSARLPIVDVVDSRDIITNSVVVQNFDLSTVTSDDLDFTASFELELKSDLPVSNTESKATCCYGVVLWFETGFTSRFCKELPTVLSTSPYTPKTHWSQTILTFPEPIAMGLEKCNPAVTALVGSDACLATRIQSRISIVRAAQHRSIDISLETSGISSDGRKRSWPVQIFNL